MDATVDFGTVFRRLSETGSREHQTVLGGVEVRVVRLEAGTKGRWDRHDDTAETVVVGSGHFDVAYRDHTVSLAAGQCCVVPVGAEHQGGTETGAEVILFKTVAV